MYAHLMGLMDRVRMEMHSGFLGAPMNADLAHVAESFSVVIMRTATM